MKRSQPFPPGQGGAARRADSGEETGLTSTVDRVPDPAVPEFGAEWDRAYEKTLLRRALLSVQDHISLKQYQIFDLYVLREWSVLEVARTLGVSVARVYLTKHRVTALVTKAIRKLEALGSRGRLAAIEVDPLNPVYSSVDGVLHDKNQTTVILCPRGKPVSITIPGSVSSIAYDAFKDCIGLKAVYFLGDAPAHADDAFANTSATLFYLAGSSGWESTLAGRPTVSWNGRFGAHSLEMYASLTIIGEIGKVYSIEYVTDLTDAAESDWRCLEYLQLPASPYLWADKSAPATGKRFYRAVAMEPPTSK